jgi:4-hydroxy-2-oxoheptanedioate aldolase
MVQIETKEALEAVDEIAAVKGIDVLFVGPFDLGKIPQISPLTSVDC